MKIRHSLFVLISVITIYFSQFLRAETNFSNPVLPGDFPDPSIVRVGNDYWATATSSEWAPLFPILHSRDLVNWDQVGTIFNEKPDWSVKNYWAPEISYYKNKFYVYYVGKKKDGPLAIAVATAEKPTGPWTDHGVLVAQPEGSIDAVTAVDENEKRFLMWKNDGNSQGKKTVFYLQQLSEDGTKLVGEMKSILQNDAAWEGSIIEGPFMLKRGDWFYIFYAGGNGCCGKKCNYGTGVARSKKLSGPYEKFSGNPILSNNEVWICPGHGSVVTTTDGRDYFLCHAYRAMSSNYVGREGVLSEITWNDDGWPKINSGKGVPVTAPSPLGKTQQNEPEFSDDFTLPNLGARWQWPHSLEPQKQMENGELILTSAVGHADELFGSVVAVQTTTANYAATTLVDIREMKAGTKAGLFAFGDAENALGITFGKEKTSVFRRRKNKTEMLGEINSPTAEKIYLRMEAKDGHRFEFSIWDGNDWKRVGENTDLEGDYLPPWDRGVRIALTVGGDQAATAKFDWLRVVPK